MDINGYDHILFVVALCAVYQMTELKKVLILITAFTLGHSITLALATLDLLSINKGLIEFLIPVTIFITAISNIIKGPNQILNVRMSINYLFAAGFGLIHGMGFSSYLKSLLGRDTNIVNQLLAFNIGLEIGQLVIVGIFLMIGFIITNIFGSTRKDWNLAVSSGVAAIAITLMIDTKFW